MSFVARCFPAEISKTGRHTNVVCCKAKILHSEQNPGPNAAPKRETTQDSLTGVGTPFGGRNVGKPMKVGRTWGYG